jgi:hypothetical protein
LGHGLDLSGSGYGPVTEYCKHSSGNSDFIQSTEFFDKLSNCQVLRKDRSDSSYVLRQIFAIGTSNVTNTCQGRLLYETAVSTVTGHVSARTSYILLSFRDLIEFCSEGLADTKVQLVLGERAKILSCSVRITVFGKTILKLCFV